MEAPESKKETKSQLTEVLNILIKGLNENQMYAVVDFAGKMYAQNLKDNGRK